jgi:hypothetical protein
MIHAVAHQTLNQPTHYCLHRSRIHLVHTEIVACRHRISRDCCVIHRTIIIVITIGRRSSSRIPYFRLVLRVGNGSSHIDDRHGTISWAAPQFTSPAPVFTSHHTRLLLLLPLLLHEHARRHLTCLLGLSAILRVQQTQQTQTAQTQRSLASDCARLHQLP